jgi:hypothetical protein
MSFFHKKYRYFYPSAFEKAYDPFYEKAKWKLCFAWLPHYCEITNTRIWLEKGYQGRRSIIMTDDDEPIIEERWHSIDGHILWKMKK